MKISRALFVLTLITSLAACKNNLSSDKQMQKKLKTLESLTYRFGDSSVPPPYHRSYDLNFNKDSITLKVDSYGDVLAEKTYAMPEGGLQKIAAALLKNKISKAKSKKENKGCTGGTSRSISYSCAGDKESFSASAYYCGGDRYGDLAGDIDSFLVELKTSFVPDLGEVIRSTEK